MTTEELSIKRSDHLYKMLAATGFLIDAFNEAETLGPYGQSIFKMSVKNAAVKFKKQLEAAERTVTGVKMEDQDTAMDQMAESYLLMDRLLTMCMKANRKLNPQAFEIMNAELEGVAKKWGIDV